MPSEKGGNKLQRAVDGEQAKAVWALSSSDRFSLMTSFPPFSFSRDVLLARPSANVLHTSYFNV